MKINLIEKSHISEIDKSKAPFGKVFSDHMLFCIYKDGKWQEPEIRPYGEISYSPGLMALHYGQAIFEGMKAYKDANENVFLFRPKKNFLRFNKSAERLAMPTITKEIFLDGLFTLIDIDRNWIPRDKGSSLYIRPFMYASEIGISAKPASEYTFIILTSIANSYYDKPLKVKIETNYTRASQGGTGFAKCAGNYAASFYPVNLANTEGFDQVIWTDYKEHKYFEESGTMNVIVRINDILYTPPVSDTILSGVTRDSLIEIAKYKNIEVREERISIEDIYTAYKKGELKEVFGCGTAVILNRYSHIGLNNEMMILPELEEKDSLALQLKNTLVNIQTNQEEDPFGWRVKVEKNKDFNIS